jgi:hypothetical protein
MTHNSSQIPERWLDLATGYVGLTALFAICLGIIALITR